MPSWDDSSREEWQRAVRVMNGFYARIRHVPDNRIVVMFAELTATLGSATLARAIEHFDTLEPDAQTALATTLMAMADLRAWLDRVITSPPATARPWYLDSPILARRVGYLSDCTRHLLDQILPRAGDDA